MLGAKINTGAVKDPEAPVEEDAAPGSDRQRAKATNVRALYRATRIPGEQAPYDTLTLKVYYPCRFSDSPEERKSGVIPADASRAPFAVVVLLPDIDIPHESYGWLASELAQAGFAAVTYGWIAEDDRGTVRSTPGVHPKRLTKRRYGRKPSCPALPAVFSELKRINRAGPLEGLLNLSCVVLGGHSTGGRMALLNANTDWFPAVCGVFSYAAHTLAEPELGWDKHNIIPLPQDVPMLLMGGTDDGVIAAAGRPRDSREASGATEKIERTFRHGVKGKRGDRYMVLLDGANHFTFVSPQDGTTGFTFLDGKSRRPGKPLRKYLSQIIVTFCDTVCCGDPMSTADLKALCNTDHPLVARAEHK
jgi:pimeloyl-ACP methyl ester carboxylesterase